MSNLFADIYDLYEDNLYEDEDELDEREDELDEESDEEQTDASLERLFDDDERFKCPHCRALSESNPCEICGEWIPVI